MKFNLKRLTSLGVSLSLIATMTACGGNRNNSNSSVEANKSKIEDTILNPENDLEKVDSEKKKEVLAPADVLANLTPEDKPIRLQASHLDENGKLVYEEFGPEFIEKEINGLKYLIKADTKEVVLSGYRNLGRLCCLDSIKKENGGTDSNLGYSGYVLLAIYNVDGKNLFSLYDFDDFKLLLKDCDLAGSSSFSQDIFTLFYIAPYDPKYRGCDDENAFTGRVFIVEKDDIRYFVDVNDFTKIVLSGDFTFYDINHSTTGNATVRYTDYSLHQDIIYTSEELIPKQSDVLQRALTKNED